MLKVIMCVLNEAMTWHRKAATLLYRDTKIPKIFYYTWYIWEGLPETSVTFSDWPLMPPRSIFFMFICKYCVVFQL